jgi:hypothetical protein
VQVRRGTWTIQNLLMKTSATDRTALVLQWDVPRDGPLPTITVSARKRKLEFTQSFLF